jgi:hypothetical protein
MRGINSEGTNLHILQGMDEQKSVHPFGIN